MITTELRNIDGRLTSNAKMNTGMAFMNLIRREGLLEASTGIFPAICGGAVRDCLFTGNEINDIDIFFFRDTRSPSIERTSRLDGNNTAIVLSDFRNNVLTWLEDQEIESESLLSTRAADYFGGQRFIDIIQFVWQDTTIQLMIPVANQLNTSIDYLLRTLPIYSGMCVTQEYFRSFDTTLAHMFLEPNQFFVATDRDVPYLRNKTANIHNVQYIPVASSREAAQMALHNFMQPISALPNGMSLDPEELTRNSSTNLVRRAFSERMSIPLENITPDNRVIHTL